MLFDSAITRSLAAMYVTHFTPIGLIGSSVISMEDTSFSKQEANQPESTSQLPVVLLFIYSGTGLESRMLRSFFINSWKFMLHRTK